MFGSVEFGLSWRPDFLMSCVSFLPQPLDIPEKGNFMNIDHLFLDLNVPPPLCMLLVKACRTRNGFCMHEDMQMAAG